MWKKTPKRLWRDVEEAARPKLRVEKAKEAKARAEKALTVLEREREAAREDRQALAGHPGTEPGARAEARRLRRLALGLLLVDVPVQFFLNGAAFPDVPTWIVALTAAPVALAFALLAHAGALLLFGDKDRPLRGIRWCRWSAQGTFVAAVLAFAVFVFARQATPEMAGHLVTVTALSLWVLAEALPFSAGFIAAWARILTRPERVEEGLRALESEIADWEGLLERVTPLAGESTAPEAHEGQTDLFRPPHAPSVNRGAGAALAILLALGGLAMPLQVQAQERTCAVMVDRTLSVDPAHRGEALGLLSRALPTFPRALGCTALVAGTFADQGPWAPRVWLRVPAVPDAQDCDAVEAPPPEDSRRVLAGFAGFRRHWEEKAREACREEEARARGQFDRERATFLAAARRATGAPQLAQETHTDLVGVVESLLDAGVDLALLVTDGLETAHDTVPPIPEGPRVVLVLVPAAEGYGGREATREAARAWERAGARTIPYTALVAPTGWARLAAADANNSNQRRNR